MSVRLRLRNVGRVAVSGRTPPRNRVLERGSDHFRWVDVRLGGIDRIRPLASAIGSVPPNTIDHHAAVDARIFDDLRVGVARP
jgi:hypothetical protein